MSTESTNKDEQKVILSFTKASMYLGCPMQYKFKYVDKAPDKPNINFILGDALHKAMEFNDIHYIKNKTHLENSLVLDKFKEILTKNCAVLFPAQKGYTKSKQFKIWLSEGLGMVEAYINNIKSREEYIPLIDEQEFMCELSTADVAFRGFIDQITQDDIIKDRKTSKAYYPVKKDVFGKAVINPDTGNEIFDGDHIKKIQLIMYAIWFRKNFKRKEKGLQYEVVTKHVKPKIQIIDVLVTEQEIQDAIKRLEYVSNNIKEGVFPPTPGQQCNWCDFKDKCPSQKKSSDGMINFY